MFRRTSGEPAHRHVVSRGYNFLTSFFEHHHLWLPWHFSAYFRLDVELFNLLFHRFIEIVFLFSIPKY